MARLIEARGGDGPVNEGERRVIAALLDALPNDYQIIPNVEIADPGGQRYEYDAIAIAPHAVYVLETKDWRGKIRGDDREWLVNGRSRKAPLIVAERKAKVLKSKLVNRLPALARVRVEAVIALATAPDVLELTPDGARHVFSLTDLPAFLADPAAVRQRPEAIVDLTGHVIRALSAQLRPRSGPLAFGPYEVIERLEQSGDEALYRARHRLLPGAPPIRLRVVTLSPYTLTPEQIAERREALLRETTALLRMGSHPNIIAARDVFDDDGRVVLVLDGIDGRTLRQHLKDGTPLTVEERLGVLGDLCQALAHAHAHGVIHRRVEPASVLICDDGVTRLARFGLAKILDDSVATVWHDEAAAEIDPRYLAPELLNRDLAPPGPATDLYGLGCVAYELFAGHPPFDDPRQAFDRPPALPSDMPEELATLAGSLLAGDPTLRPVDAKDVLAALARARAHDRPRSATGPKIQYVPGDLIDGKFEVREFLGGGGFSFVYRVYRALEDREYALKVFNADVQYDKVQREFELLRGIEHPHIVRAVWADATRAGQWYLVSELIRGEPLDDYASGKKRLAVEQAVQVADDLLAALEAIHPDQRRLDELEAKREAGELEYAEFGEIQALKASGIVHRDIKPQNLLLTAEGVVLIDFNIASRVGQQVLTLSGTPPYQSPDVLRGLEIWDVSPDLFATGLVLYELLCHEHPYEDRQPRMDRQPRDPRQFRLELSMGLATFLLRACAPARADRFASALEMRAALTAVDPLVTPDAVDGTGELPPRLRELLADAPPNVNPMVREFLALSSQARRTNRGTRGLDDLARATYVETALDNDLAASVLAGRHRLVIVTGNAGDGKTAFIQQVEEAARSRGAEDIVAGPNGGRLRYAGREIITLYDGSQDEADRASDTTLLDFFAPSATGAPSDGTARLAAINEGRLRDFLLAHRGDFPQLAKDVIAVLDDPSAAMATGEEVVVVNLNLRSVTAGGTASIFSRQLRRIVEGPFWGPCEACDYRARCPLKHNVDTLRDPTSGLEVMERLRVLVDLIRLRRRRHLTMRDVRSLLSHLLFRDRICEEVPHLLALGNPLAIADVAYFQGVGGLGSPPESALERGAALLTEIDPALVANPEDDRALANGRGPRRMAFPGRDGNYPEELIAQARAAAGGGYGANPTLARRAHEAARRQLYFERADDGWRRMLPYARHWEFETALDPAQDVARDRLRREVVTAISTYEGMDDAALTGDALWLAAGEAGERDYRAFRRFPLTDFALRVARPQARYVEAEPDRLELLYLPQDARRAQDADIVPRLDLDLDLLEVLERLREGYMPSLEEARGFLINLALFKHRLLAEPASELVLLAGGQLLRIGVGANLSAGSVVLSEERR